MYNINRKVSYIMIKINNKKLTSGFTIVELIVVIVIIGILAAVSAVGYGSWQKKIAETQIKSDLKGAASAMENYKNFNSGYPSLLPSTFTSSKGITLIGGSANGEEYCIDAQSSQDSDLHYYIDQDNTSGDAQIGTCATRPKKWASVAVGYYHTCAVTNEGLAYCWGINDNGQLGNNSTTNSNKPVAVNTDGALNGKTIKSITVGDYNSCAIDTDNLAYCWGLNSSGQLGNNSTTSSSVPVAVSMVGKAVKSISTGDNYSCAIANDGLAYCWGLGTSGQLGNNNTINMSVPTPIYMDGVLKGLTIKSISTGAFSTCAIASDNLSYCWGKNNISQLGNNSNVDVFVPVRVLGPLDGTPVKEISAGEYHACALTFDNDAYCWGWNLYGQLGDGSNNSSAIPIAIKTDGALSDSTISFLKSGKYGVCAISSGSKAYCWGWGVEGQIGNNTTSNSNVPVAVTTSGALNGLMISSISVGDYHACALSSDHAIYCWGADAYGQLGNGLNARSLVPVKVIEP